MYKLLKSKWQDNEGTTRLGSLLAAGTGIFLIVGFLLLCFFTRIIDGGGPWWITGHELESGQWYDIVRSTIGAVGVLSVAAVGLIAYRRQKTGEETYKLELDRHKNSSSVDLRTRFTTASEQLGHSSPAVRMAGAYAMAALAHDWHNARDETQKQLCIDVLCAYLRIPYTTSENIEDRGDQPVRWTIITIITNHLQDPASDDSWCGHDFDFTGATFDGGDFDGAKFSGGNVSFRGTQFTGDHFSFADAEFSGGNASFADAEFTGGNIVSFRGTKFSGGNVSFRGTQFTGGNVYFLGAEFTGGNVSFIEAEFAAGKVSFDGAEFFYGSTISFAGAEFYGSIISFAGAEFRGGDVSFADAEFTAGDVFFDGAELRGSNVSFLNARFADDSRVSFASAEFTGGSRVSFASAEFDDGSRVTFADAGFTGHTVDFRSAKFRIAAEVDFRSPRKWEPGPLVDWEDTAPIGVLPTAWPPSLRLLHD